jgi:hypothetical protein
MLKPTVDSRLFLFNSSLTSVSSVFSELKGIFAGNTLLVYDAFLNIIEKIL